MSAAYTPDGNGARPATSLEGLRRLVRNQPASPPVVVEHCELCNEVLATNHRHLLDLAGRTLVCSCTACSLLFDKRGAGHHYRLIPNRYLLLPNFQMTDAQWDELMIPVNIVFLFRSTIGNPVAAFYPGPAGATESLLDLEGWAALTNANPILNELETDVEALLVNRVRTTREYYIVPIDTCYQLVGLIRLKWRGLSGGTEAWEEINKFFQELRQKSDSVE